jgi:hypothetical protein
MSLETIAPLSDDPTSCSSLTHRLCPPQVTMASPLLHHRGTIPTERTVRGRGVIVFALSISLFSRINFPAPREKFPVLIS